MILNNFIVFEGIDGAGTTTQIRMLMDKAEKEGLKERFFFTAEPTKASTGQYLRKMLRGDFCVTNETAAYLFAADRNEHINGTLCTEGNALITGIKEACRQDRIVISDRYFFSSLAYQSITCNPDVPRALNAFFPLPVLMFYFDIEPSVSIKRLGARDYREIYEKEDFLNKAVNEYRKILKEYSLGEKNQGMKTVIIDATANKEYINSLIWKELQSILSPTLKKDKKMPIL